MRAENSETDSGQSGEITASAPSAQPPAKAALRQRSVGADAK
jgi:hypothetical protein